MLNIVFLGECMIEHSGTKDFCFGGDTLNSALYFARVASKDKVIVSYATAVGQDHDSLKLIEIWQQESINTSFVSQIKGKQLGSYLINNNEQGERSFSYNRADSAAKYYFTYPNKVFEDALITKSIDCVYFSGISLAILSDQDCHHLFKLLTAFKREGGQIIFDNNYRSVLWKHRQPLPFYQQAMKLADIAFLTDEDEYALFGGNSVVSILERYPLSSKGSGTELVIKQGENPCVIRTTQKKDSVFTVASSVLSKDKIIDTCAAGDAFAAGYLSKRLMGCDVNESAQFAHKLAGRVIQYSGAIIPLNNMNDLISLN